MPLLKLFRERGWPVLYPYVAPKMGYDAGRLAREGAGDHEHRGAAATSSSAEIAPRESDMLLPKKHPSAFFGTPLASYLIDLGVDTLVVTGCTHQRLRARHRRRWLRLQLPRRWCREECVFDRSPVSHAVNLFDMAYKYADVMPVRDVMAALP